MAGKRLPKISSCSMDLGNRIGFLGAGQMARALAHGFSSAGLVRPEQMAAYDPLDEAGAQLVEQVPGVRILGQPQAVVAAADVVIVAVKPQSLAQVFSQLAGAKREDPLWISIVAGVPLETFQRELGSARVIRVMPNTPCLVGRGASGYALGSGATPEDGQLVGQLLQSVGVAFALPEPLLDAVTGLSGSGPAYIYAVIEALSDGGVRMGLPRQVATPLAAQTVLGGAEMVLRSREHPAVLKERVTSPGGTTIVGLQILERSGLRAALMDAVEAAARRAEELGESS